MATFNLYDEIGSGGYGNVYKSARVIDGKAGEIIYAVKKLKKNLDENAIERFKREVRILKILNHPNIIKVITENLECDEPFYVMPLYKQSLKGILDELKDDYERLKLIFNSLFNGIEYLHNEGVYHRDLKAENILINADSDLVINDFGLGLKVDSNTTRLTTTGMYMGTFYYMSPEQLNDAKHIDHRTDIYSIGKILFECLTGEIGINVDVNKIPKGLRYVVRKCLMNNPDERFQKVSELRNTFNASIDIIIQGTSLKSLRSIIDSIVTTDDYNELLPELINILSKIDLEKEKDNIHEMIMKLPKDIIIDLVDKDAELGYQVIENYVDNITAQSWPFNYTDSIGMKVKEIFYGINNDEIKAKLIYCVGEVGLYHNRWYVMDLFKEMLSSIDNGDLAFLVISELEKLNKDRLKECIGSSSLNLIIENWLEQGSLV